MVRDAVFDTENRPTLRFASSKRFKNNDIDKLSTLGREMNLPLGAQERGDGHSYRQRCNEVVEQRTILVAILSVVWWKLV